MSAKKRSSRAPGRQGGRGRGKAPSTGPSVRSPGVKVTAPAASALRAGHPWIFRDALTRPLSLDTGSVVSVSDEDGHKLGFGLVDRDATVAVRMIGRGETGAFEAPEVRARIDKALARRERLMDDGTATARRLVHGEGDGLPGFAVDRFGDFLVVYKYARCIEPWVETALDHLMEVVGPEGIYLQDRVRPVAAEDHRPAAANVRGKAAPPEYEVEEDGLRFLVDPSAPVSPGLFLDLREGRRLAEQWCGGKRVLNLFSFTGAFGVRAVRAKAEEVVNVDAAARSHARCRQNLAASGLDSEAVEGLVGDVFKHLEKFRQRERTFDFAVVDPPPFSNVDGQVFSALKNWQELVTATAQVMAPGGLMLAVCNAAGLPEQDFLNALGRGAAAARRGIRIVSELGLPPDFPVVPAFTEGRYLKVKLVEFS